jgi:hypothetical protein
MGRAVAANKNPNQRLFILMRSPHLETRAMENIATSQFEALNNKTTQSSPLDQPERISSQIHSIKLTVCLSIATNQSWDISGQGAWRRQCLRAYWCMREQNRGNSADEGCEELRRTWLFASDGEE